MPVRTPWHPLLQNHLFPVLGATKMTLNPSPGNDTPSWLLRNTDTFKEFPTSVAWVSGHLERPLRQQLTLRIGYLRPPEDK